MTKSRLVFWGLVPFFVSLGCVVTIPVPGRAPTLTVTLLDTPTLTHTLTFTPEPSQTPLPTPTRREMVTEAVFAFPTITSLPPIPTMTLPRFEETVIGGTFTPTQSGGPVKIYTPTREPLKCRVTIVKPEVGQDVPKGKDFEVVWRIYNEGGKIWGINQFYFDFLSGDRMHNPGHGPWYLPYKVYSGDRFRLNVRMTAPRSPGRYSATWGMWQVGRKEPFCTFSVTIDVK